MQIKGTIKPKFPPSQSVIPRQINIQKFFKAKYDRPNSEIKYASGSVDISNFLSKNKDYSTLDNSQDIQDNNSKKNIQTNRYYQQSHTIDINQLEKSTMKKKVHKNEKIQNSPFFTNQARKTKPMFGVKYMKLSSDINQNSVTQRQNFRQINLQQAKSQLNQSEQENNSELNLPSKTKNMAVVGQYSIGQRGFININGNNNEDGQYQTMSQFSRTQQQKQRISQSVNMQNSQKNEFTRISQSVEKDPNQKLINENQNVEIFKPQIKIICSYRTRQGYLVSNPEKVNQDTFQICQNFCKKGQHLFFVCDGHGANGHFVSNFIKTQYPRCLQKTINNGNSLHEAIDIATNYVNKIVSNVGIDVQLSGSTFIQIIIDTQTGKLVCGNVGDSRAMIASINDKTKEWIAHPLSQDHKPNVPNETQRIISSGGRVDSYKDSYGRSLGPKRVWLKNENIPGLAMSRSIGDLVAQSVGVSPQPEISYYQITFKDKIIVIASDGVWEFLSNEQVMQLIIPFFEKGDINSACETLMKEALSQWTSDDGSVVDDITFIIIFIEEIKNVDQ